MRETKGQITDFPLRPMMSSVVLSQLGKIEPVQKRLNGTVRSHASFAKDACHVLRKILGKIANRRAAKVAKGAQSWILWIFGIG